MVTQTSESGIYHLSALESLGSPVSLEFSHTAYQRITQIQKHFADNGRPAGQTLSSPVDGGAQEGALWQEARPESFIQGQKRLCFDWNA